MQLFQSLRFAENLNDRCHKNTNNGIHSKLDFSYFLTRLCDKIRRDG